MYHSWMPAQKASACTTDPASVNETSISERQRVRLQSLFPGLSDGDLNHMGETLGAYCATVWRIYERLKREHPEIIDELMRTRTMKGKVDSSKQNQTM